MRALAGDLEGADLAFAAAEVAGPPDGWQFCFPRNEAVAGSSPAVGFRGA